MSETSMICQCEDFDTTDGINCLACGLPLHYAREREERRALGWALELIRTHWPDGFETEEAAAAYEESCAVYARMRALTPEEPPYGD